MLMPTHPCSQQKEKEGAFVGTHYFPLGSWHESHTHHFCLHPTGQNFITLSRKGSCVAMCPAKMKGFWYWKEDSRYWETVCHSDSLVAWDQPVFPASFPSAPVCVLELKWIKFYSEAFRSHDLPTLYLCCSPSAMPLRCLFSCPCFVNLIFPSKSISPAFT